MPRRPGTTIAAVLLTAGALAAGVLTGPAAHGSDRPVTAGPSAPNPSPYPPTAPAGPAATAVHAASVSLAWTASRPGCCPVDHYEIHYSLAFDDVVRSADAGNATATTITGLAPGHEYTFRVAAVDVVDHRSASSDPVTVVTPASDTAADTTPPSAPAGLTTTAVTSSGAVLSWSPSTDDVGVVGYDVYRFDGWYTSTLLGSTAGTTYVAPTGGGRILFYVRARDAAGNVSIASNTVTTVTTTPPPTTPPVTTEPPAPACAVGYRVTSAWAGGFVAEVTVTNAGAATLDGWSLTFTYGGDQRLTASWNGDFTQSGPDVTLTGASWNRTLAAGASTTVGVLGSWRAGNAPPTGYAVGGRPCAAA
ncbi:hypothetical protein GCM10020358_61580 [Amorphoplanes nipponensis]|uniref:Fibronectin type III domain-containing protein n=1 Tax=Actinoplanes nipponensis TaxID=135950 RepID=A0A919MQS9_9ACTN|nr:cellulose binding domain-containing protein [Actinoplanes nipponensis]GIE53961.1 hypothetical protein Ani05nite_74950 [Actinoplanes nipponensis]